MTKRLLRSLNSLTFDNQSRADWRWHLNWTLSRNWSWMIKLKKMAPRQRSCNKMIRFLPCQFNKNSYSAKAEPDRYMTRYKPASVFDYREQHINELNLLCASANTDVCSNPRGSMVSALKPGPVNYLFTSQFTLWSPEWAHCTKGPLKRSWSPNLCGCYTWETCLKPSSMHHSFNTNTLFPFSYYI